MDKTKFRGVVVPVEIHRKLKEQAKAENRSISGLLREWVAREEDRLDREGKKK
jgi:predicted CopG family antitoxin